MYGRQRDVERTVLHLMGWPALLLAMGVVFFAGCDACALDEQNDNEADDSDGRREDRGDAEKTREPLIFDVAPLEGNHIDVDIPLETPDGKEIRLRELLAYRSLLVYMDSDTKDRHNRAATRMLQKVIKGGRDVAFRIVVIFPKGTDEDDVEDWFKKRKIARSVLAAIDTHGRFAEATGWALRSVALVDDTGTVGALWGRSERWSARLGFEGFTDDFFMKAWALPEGGPTLDEQTQRAAVEVVRAAIAHSEGEEGLPDEVKTSLTQPGLERSSDHPVHVSLFRKGSSRHLRGSSNAGKLGEAVARATWDALGQADGEAEKWRAAGNGLRFVIDLEGPSYPLPTRAPRPLWFLIEPGVHGLRLKAGAKEAVLLPGEAVSEGILTPRVPGRNKKINALMTALTKRAGVGKDDWRIAQKTELCRFRTTSFGIVTAEDRVQEVFRGNVLAKADPGSREILEGIRRGGRWLLERVAPDGKFGYEYLPNTDQWTEGYNIVRHAGSVYGLLEMWHLAQKEPLLAPDASEYMDAVARAITYIFDALNVPQNAKGTNRLCLLDEKGSCESGSAALTLLTLLERPAPDQVPARYRDTLYPADQSKELEALGNTLLDMIDAKGKVWRRYSEAVSQSKVKKEPLYYPGETLLALMALYERTHETRWLEGARRIADRQAASYRKDRFQWPDHWVMQGFYRLWRIDGKDAYAKTAYEMATHSSSEQYGHLWSPYPDYRGGWRRKSDTPRTTRAGSRMEAIRAVVYLAWERGDDAKIWEDSLIFGARHLIEQQYRTDNMWWVPNEAPARGCFPMGIVDNSCRIDNNQHALIGLLGALDVARKREGL